MSKHIDAEGRMAESTMRIKDLAQAEKKLVLLLETVAEALSILSDEAPSDEENIDEFVRNRAMNFRHLASRYFSLVNDIQFALRSHTNYLTKEASITSSANKIIPFKNSVLGQYKELEIWTEAIETISQRITEIKSIALE